MPRAGPKDSTTAMDLIGLGRSLAQTRGAETHIRLPVTEEPHLGWQGLSPHYLGDGTHDS